MTITAAVDGSALHNPGPAGWCWYIDDGCWAAGGWKEGTNNRGELTALAELLRATAHLPNEQLYVLCDSQYVINSVTKWMPGWKRKGWKKRDGKPVLNVDILKDIDQLMLGRSVHFEWVKGHSGHAMNEAADDRARAAATAYQRGTEVPTGPGFGGRVSSASAPTSSAATTAQPLARQAADLAQDSLFDLAAGGTASAAGDAAFDDGASRADQANRVSAAQRALTVLRRAAHRAEQGNPRALKAVLRDAVGANLIVPDGLDEAEHTLRVVGSTAVAQFTFDGWVAMAVWDLSRVAGGAADGTAELVGWNVGRA